MWWKKHRWKVIAPVLLAAVLAFAFWYGGDSPGSRGWSIGQAPQFSSDSQGGKSASSEESAAAAPATREEQDCGNISKTELPADGMLPESEEEAVQPSGTPAPDGETASQPEEPEPAADPAAEETPPPVEPEEIEVSETAWSCTISISCVTILDNMDWLDSEKEELVPEDGWLLPPTEVTFYEGESVFHVLQRTCKQQGIHMEYMNTPLYNSAYIEGIGNLYEFDCGSLSGWLYQVNGWFPNYSCSRYVLSDGDEICWVYSCDLGEDVGGGYAAGTQI